MQIEIFQVDAFTSSRFSGNPASVCLLTRWPNDLMLQKIAAENNQAETAFLVAEQEGYRIRWFTPAVEVDLCGHATIAAGLVLSTLDENQDWPVLLFSRSGILKVTKENDWYTLDFPADEFSRIEILPSHLSCFKLEPTEVYQGKTDLLFIYQTENEIRHLQPDLSMITSLGGRGVIVSAPGELCDFVSRFFAPAAGIPEDHVTGSAHTTLTPYWSKRLQKTKLSAKQLSTRGGDLICRINGSRVEISGQAVIYLRGTIFI